VVGDYVARDGLVMIRQGSVEGVRALLAGWTEPVRHPHDREAGLTIVTPQPTPDGFEGLTGFTRARLAPHTDRSLQPEPPSLLAAVMISPAVSGGHALLVDGAQVLAGLRRSFTHATIGNLRLQPADGNAVPVVLASNGLARIRFRDDRIAVPASASDDQQVVDALRDLVAAATTSVRLGPGDGYIVHNHRYLHGRSSFAGDRRLGRMLAKVGRHRLAWLNQGFRIAYP
jgi:hypothetical protein